MVASITRGRKQLAGEAFEAERENGAAAARDGYLCALGERVRGERARRGMTRKILARDAGLSERYLAQLEAGKGNMSIDLLRRVAAALNLPLGRLVGEEYGEPVELGLAIAALRRCSPDDLREARRMLETRFGRTERGERGRRIALIGLRGAGKSTLGRRLAQHLAVPFIELDHEIERDCGLSLGEIFALHGQAAYRRSERRALDGALDRHPAFVLAAGGSIVADAATFERLLAGCFTVWLAASPEEHMSRVIEQGDLRPMADNREAMADLKRILSVRGPLYARADATVDTAGRTLDASFRQLLAAVPQPVAAVAAES
ncbi:MAG TPA: helix-turn-helix transcriptional regulator [Stellaceae bacterium]|nr:helix-turn-helix transcriptional regulator [Stellaceae bacterium]